MEWVDPHTPNHPSPMPKPAHAPDLIAAFNGGREAERLAMKYRAMRTNAFVFLRGSAHLYFQRYAEAGLDDKAPAAWCCNDLHLENFGTYLGDNGLSYFDLNDFDEAALAPADWDVVRLVTSLLVAAEPLEIAKGRAGHVAKAAVETYVREMTRAKSMWLERRTARGPIGELIDGLKNRDDVTFLERRTVVKKGTRRLDIDSKRMLPIAKADRDALAAFLAKLPIDGRSRGFFDMHDAARRVAGTGSLGLARFAVLVEGEGSPDGNVLLDIKEATPSAAAPFSPYQQPAWASEAERVVTLQARGQAVTPAYLRAVAFQKRPFIMKMLQPTADRLDLARLARAEGEFHAALCDMAALTAWSELRASGRQGSATADALIEMVRAPGFAASVIERAKTMAEVVAADFAAYAAVYDETRMGLK